MFSDYQLNVNDLTYNTMNLSQQTPDFRETGIKDLMAKYHFSKETMEIVEEEGLLPGGLLKRLHTCYPEHSGFVLSDETIFNDKNYYSGLSGFREIISILNLHGIDIGHIREREFFIEVYRFLATRHALNAINWNNFKTDSIFQLMFPQPGMIKAGEVRKYLDATSEEERQMVVDQYQTKTNPHDGKQKLNKPWFLNSEGELEILHGCQHKYPPIKLILDKTTQNCFAYCTYCFRHAQVRGDEDMFAQDSVKQVHDYLKKHKEISDILLTGGDGGFITYERLIEYVQPVIEDPELIHIKNIRFGSRALTYQPELILSKKFNKILNVWRNVIDNGIQVVWVAHFSTPRELLNPGTVAAIRRLKKFGINVKSQSPIMNHISLFKDENGKTDIDKSAQNWIDVGNILGMLGVGFHSMYCARPTGEHHYFTAPLADINRIFSKVYRSLASINRPSRYITMTSSAGKTSLLGTTEIMGEKVFVLKFNESRNMEWMDQVFFGLYDENEDTIEKLKPYGTDKYFFRDELNEIEDKLSGALEKEIKNQEINAK